MEIEKLDYALSIREKIDALMGIKKQLQDAPDLQEVLTKEYKDFAFALPGDDVFNEATVAMKKFHSAWISQIDSMIDSLRTEFDAL